MGNIMRKDNKLPPLDQDPLDSGSLSRFPSAIQIGSLIIVIDQIETITMMNTVVEIRMGSGNSWAFTGEEAAMLIVWINQGWLHASGHVRLEDWGLNVEIEDLDQEGKKIIGAYRKKIEDHYKEHSDPDEVTAIGTCPSCESDKIFYRHSEKDFGPVIYHCRNCGKCMIHQRDIPGTGKGSFVSWICP
jgi:hypothetical protein